jgi:hypothetical protein
MDSRFCASHEKFIITLVGHRLGSEAARGLQYPEPGSLVTAQAFMAAGATLSVADSGAFFVEPQRAASAASRAAEEDSPQKQEPDGGDGGESKS